MRFARSPWTRSKRQRADIPACRWAWPRSPLRSGIATCGTTPAQPHWPDRDRFVVSNGHGSMLLYALLHLTGYDLPLDELKRFRQLHSKTPGHPEFGATPGVETTTGPLGQGLANAVGMALAERLLAAEFNRPGHAIVDHRTYVFVGDGCLMEGISHEACSLAGTLRLAKLVALYDDNGISIDGEVKGWFTDDTPMRFEAYGWHVIRNVDGHDVDAVDRAVKAAQASDRPTLVCCKTVIGKGAPTKAGTADCHGSALGEKEVAGTRTRLAWTHAPFAIPAEIYASWDARERGKSLQGDWDARFAAYRTAFPDLAAAFERRMQAALPAQWSHIAARIRVAPGRQGRNGRHPQSLAAGDRGVRRRAAGDDRRLRRPHRLRLHELVAQHAGHCGGRGQLRQLRRARIRDVRNGQRARAAWRIHSLCRNVPDLLRLCAQCAAHGGAHEAPRGVRVHARFDRPRRGRPDAPGDRARRKPAPHSGHDGMAAVRHGGNRRGVGGSASKARMRRRACCSRARTFRSRSAVTIRSRPSAAAATCWPTGPTTPRRASC